MQNHTADVSNNLLAASFKDNMMFEQCIRLGLQIFVRLPEVALNVMGPTPE